MKCFGFLAGLVAATVLSACQTNPAAPGAVGEKADCSAACKSGAAAECCKNKTAAPAAAPGAVSSTEAKSGCCKDKAAAATCPATGTAAPAAAPGAVSSKKSGCGSGAAKCPVTGG
ncbi:MAG: hypothetical protein EXS00_06110 [Phycisphaerales bacterium]|nr:hypothetical protein [Phycisphaerales bacterium]